MAIVKEATCFGGPMHGKVKAETGYKFQTLISTTSLSPTFKEAITTQLHTITYSLERYVNREDHDFYFAWVADGWWICGYPAKEFVAAGLEMVRLLSLIGSCEKWESKSKPWKLKYPLVCWAENNGIIDMWCKRMGISPQSVSRLVTYDNLYRLNGLKDYSVVLLSGWDSDKEFVEQVNKKIISSGGEYVTKNLIRHPLAYVS